MQGSIVSVWKEADAAEIDFLMGQVHFRFFSFAFIFRLRGLQDFIC